MVDGSRVICWEFIQHHQEHIPMKLGNPAICPEKNSVKKPFEHILLQCSYRLYAITLATHISRFRIAGCGNPLGISIDSVSHHQSILTYLRESGYRTQRDGNWFFDIAFISNIRSGALAIWSSDISCPKTLQRPLSSGLPSHLRLLSFPGVLELVSLRTACNEYLNLAPRTFF